MYITVPDHTYDVHIRAAVAMRVRGNVDDQSLMMCS